MADQQNTPGEDHTVSIKKDIELMRPILSQLRDDYRNRIQSALASGTFQTIGNCYPWHTRIAMDQLLTHAAKRALMVRLITGGFGEFYDDNLLSKVNDCVDCGSDVKAIVWHNAPSVIENARATVKRQSSVKGKGSFQVRNINVAPAQKPMIHFCLVGSRIYRREAKHDDFLNSPFSDFAPEVSATIAVNDPIGGKQLKEIFDDLWPVAKPVA